MRNGSKLFSLLIVMLVMVLVVAAGCGNTQQRPNSDGEQVLRVGLINDVFAERWQFMGGIGPYDSGGIFEPLVILTPDMKIEPGLATSWESVDPYTWRFQLREGVQFHSGKPFNAAAAKQSIDAFVENLNPTFLEIESVTVVSDYVLDIRTETPFPAFVEQMSHPLISIANTELTDPEGNVLPDGTGPFRLDSHVVNQQMVAVRNENYWGEKALLDRLILKMIPDHTTRLLALRSGEIDIAVRVPVGDVTALEADPDVNVHQILAPMVRHLTFTLNREPVNDVRVRQAIAHAVDREGIVDGVLFGLAGKVAPTMITPQMPWSIYGMTEGHEHNVTLAQEILAEAGWMDKDRDGIVERDGQPLRLRLLVGTHDPEGITVAEAVQDMLKQIGIVMEIVALERGAFWEAGDTGEYDIVMNQNVIASATGEILLRRAHRDSTFNRVAPIYWMGEEMDALIDEATSTFDEAERHDLYRQIQWRFHEEVVSVPIHYVLNYNASGTHVRGYVPHSSGWSQRYDGVYID